MIVTLVGVQEMDFRSQDGNQIQGVKLHVIYPSSTGIVGRKADAKFLSAARLDELGLTAKDFCGQIDSDIDISTDFNGKVIDVSFAAKK